MRNFLILKYVQSITNTEAMYVYMYVIFYFMPTNLFIHYYAMITKMYDVII